MSLKKATKPKMSPLILFSISRMHFNNLFVYATMILARSILNRFSTLGSNMG